jgi:pyruvate-formate lyase
MLYNTIGGGAAMEFYTQNGRQRPVRLSNATRKFADDSLKRKYGLETLKVFGVALDDIKDFDAFPPLERYDAAIQRISVQAPIRICDGERISGAATLGYAIQHDVPATYQDEPICPSISHLTVDFETVLKKGVNFIKKKAEKAYALYQHTEKAAFSKSCLACIAAFEVWHSRYLEELSARTEYKANYNNLLQVPFEPATNFYEAVQSLWFTFSFIRLTGNWPGIGRIDYLLGDYLKKDLKEGALTIDEAREILAHFFIKGCEWINGKYIESGDAQHYQNIILAGIDENGQEVANEVTYLVLDILEELGISDFPTSVRINKNTDEKLLRRIAEVMRFGGGMLAIYNEDLVIDALKKDGYSEREARRFANDGCWEVQIPGKTYFIYYPFDSLQILQKETLAAYDGSADFADFEELYQQYIADLNAQVEAIFKDRVKVFESNVASLKEWKWAAQIPCTVVSLFEGDCIEKGLSYLEGGPVYNVISPHIGGLADTVNSLYAIKKLIYDEKKITFTAFLDILKNNWEGEEVLRQYILNSYVYYGNDNDEVDLIARRLLSDFADICVSYNDQCGYRFPAGVSTFGRQLEWSGKRLASPHGRKSGEVLAANCSPTPNTDKEGATAIIRSYCKADLSKLATGAALDIKLLPSSVEGEDGLQALMALMRGFVELGGFFMQPDVIDASLLREAQKHPEDYQTLSVRVSGWNARFVTLNKKWQDMVIGQIER